eukprot:1993523-Rhodomonas_salina.2
MSVQPAVRCGVLRAAMRPRAGGATAYGAPPTRSRPRGSNSSRYQPSRPYALSGTDLAIAGTSCTPSAPEKSTSYRTWSRAPNVLLLVRGTNNVQRAMLNNVRHAW